MCLMLCAPLDWQYAVFLSSDSDAVLYTVLVYVRCGTSNQIKKGYKHYIKAVFYNVIYRITRKALPNNAQSMMR